MAIYESDENQVRTEIELIKRDVSSLSMVIEKLDVTIDKLTDVSNGLNRMISVHEQQITRQDQADKELFQLIEMRRKEASENYEVLHRKMSEQRDNLEADMKENFGSIMTELKQLKDSQQAHHQETISRVAELEKWKWFVIGIATTAGFILAQLPLFTNIFS